MRLPETDKVIKLDFKKLPNQSVDLTDETNLKQIKKYILPIIVQNEGWGTGYLTEEIFFSKPTKYQTDMDATVYDNVHVYLQNEQPVAILEYEEVKPTDVTDTREKVQQILTQGG